MKYVSTKDQIADMFTKEKTSAEQCQNLCRMAQIGPSLRIPQTSGGINHKNSTKCVIPEKEAKPKPRPEPKAKNNATNGITSYGTCASIGPVACAKLICRPDYAILAQQLTMGGDKRSK